MKPTLCIPQTVTGLRFGLSLSKYIGPFSCTVSVPFQGLLFQRAIRLPLADLKRFLSWVLFISCCSFLSGSGKGQSARWCLNRWGSTTIRGGWRCVWSWTWAWCVLFLTICNLQLNLFIFHNRPLTTTRLWGFFQMLAPPNSFSLSFSSAGVETTSYNGKSPPNFCWPAEMSVWEVKQNWARTLRPLPPNNDPPQLQRRRENRRVVQLVSAFSKLQQGVSCFLRRNFICHNYRMSFNGCDWAATDAEFTPLKQLFRCIDNEKQCKHMNYTSGIHCRKFHAVVHSSTSARYGF